MYGYYPSEAAYIQPSIAENHHGQDFILDIKEIIHVFDFLTY